MTSLRTLAAALNALGTGIIVVLMAMICADIALRTLTNAPLRGAAELSGLLIVALVFLQLPHTVARGRMIRSEMLLGALHARRPVAAGLVEGVFRLVGAMFFGAVAWAVWPKLVKAWERGTYVGAAGDFTAPVWPKLAVIVAGAAFAAIIYALLALAAFQRPRAVEILGEGE